LDAPSHLPHDGLATISDVVHELRAGFDLEPVVIRIVNELSKPDHAAADETRPPAPATAQERTLFDDFFAVGRALVASRSGHEDEYAASHKSVLAKPGRLYEIGVYELAPPKPSAREACCSAGPRHYWQRNKWQLNDSAVPPFSRERFSIQPCRSGCFRHYCSSLCESVSKSTSEAGFSVVVSAYISSPIGILLLVGGRHSGASTRPVRRAAQGRGQEGEADPLLGSLLRVEERSCCPDAGLQGSREWEAHWQACTHGETRWRLGSFAAFQVNVRAGLGAGSGFRYRWLFGNVRDEVAFL
jgi:hypothetical protein